ncbi:MAG: glycosyltransferase family 4 protein [Ectothiorhodospiraceae bacterium]
MTAGLHVVVPGPLHRRTGGSLYDARMVTELRALGWRVQVHELAGSFPGPDDAAEAALEAALTAIPDGSRTLVDGLALGGHPAPLARHADRLRITGLVHHPLADETGLDGNTQARLLASERAALAACDTVITTSAATRSRLGELDLYGDPVAVAEPGTDPAPPATGPAPGQPPSLVCVASLTPRKGQDVLVAALARLRQRDWHCRLIGSTTADPAFAARVRAAITRAELAERITVPGECEPAAIDAALATASFFVLPSHYEGYGMVLTEALARGLPVISTTGGAIADTVPGAAAQLVPPGDAGALAAALAAWLGDPDARAEAARAAWAHAQRLSDWPTAAGRLADILEARP